MHLKEYRKNKVLIKRKALGKIFAITPSNQFGTVKHYKQSLILIALFIVYFITLILNYQYCNNEFKNRKSEILDEFYQIIFSHSIVKLNDVLQKLPLDQTGINTLIEIDQSDIKSCYKDQCIKSNLFEFASIFDKYIPYYIQYKININKQLLHRNIKIPNYELERSNYINNYNQLSIQLSIEPKYLEGIRQKTFKSFYITFLSSSFILALYVMSIRLIKKYNNGLYKNYYETKLQESEEIHKKALICKENELMKKIWDLEYSKEKEIELNYLFSREVNKQVMISSEIDYAEFSKKNQFLPYSIPLYRNTKELESININDLAETFASRFSEINDHILLNIQSSEQNINFSSKAALYQIIYSVISYIIFILGKQSHNKRCEIILTIKIINKAVKLYFEYDGLPTEEQEIFKMSSCFYKKHANPFLLNINL